MHKLNLAYPERSDFKFEIMNFPDGHKHLKIVEYPIKEEFPKAMVIIRAHSMDDIFLAIQAAGVLEYRGYDEIILRMPYFFGSRCDRRFSIGEAPDAIIIEDILSEYFCYIDSIHPHHWRDKNDIDETDWGKGIDIFADELVTLGFKKAYPDISSLRYFGKDEPQSKAIYAEKDRIDGKIIMGDIVNFPEVTNSNIVVQDDLCDGGATFIEFAKKLKECGAAKIYLVVGNGVFSKGFDELLKYYNKIFTTNSYADHDWPENVHWLDVYK